VDEILNHTTVKLETDHSPIIINYTRRFGNRLYSLHALKTTITLQTIHCLTYI